MADETEGSPLLRHGSGNQPSQLTRSSNSIDKDPETTAEEVKMADTAVGERLKYNDYTTIDWLHDLVPRFTYAGSQFQETYSRMRVGQRLKSHARHPQSQGRTFPLSSHVR